MSSKVHTFLYYTRDWFAALLVAILAINIFTSALLCGGSVVSAQTSSHPAHEHHETITHSMHGSHSKNVAPYKQFVDENCLQDNGTCCDNSGDARLLATLRDDRQLPVLSFDKSKLKFPVLFPSRSVEDTGAIALRPDKRLFLLARQRGARHFFAKTIRLLI